MERRAAWALAGTPTQRDWRASTDRVIRGAFSVCPRASV